MKHSVFLNSLDVVVPAVYLFLPDETLFLPHERHCADRAPQAERVVGTAAHVEDELLNDGVAARSAVLKLDRHRDCTIILRYITR